EWYYLSRLVHKGAVLTLREPVGSVALGPDGKHLAGPVTFMPRRNPSAAFPQIKVWDTRTGRETIIPTGQTAGFLSVAFSPDALHLASAGLDGSVRIWDLATGQDGSRREWRGSFHAL